MTKKEQQKELYEAWSKKKTPDNMTALLRSLDSTINTVASTHGAAKDENLKWALRVHLAQDIKNRYDPAKSALQTFVYQSLQRTPRIAASQRNLVHVPESSDTDLRSLQGARQDLLDINEREPTDDELSDRAGVSLARIRALDNKFGRPIMAVSKFHVGSGGVDPASGDEAATATEQLYRQYAVDALDTTDRKIYDMLSGEVPAAKSQIASHLGISPPAVTQRLAKIIKKLDMDA